MGADRGLRSDDALTEPIGRLSARSFNFVNVDRVRGVVRKSSTDAPATLIDEINYLIALPVDLRALFPEVFRHSVEPSSPWIELEYYAHPSLAEIFLGDTADPATWERIFSILQTTLRRLDAHSAEITRGDVVDMYSRKPKSRLREAASLEHLYPLVKADRLEINGQERPGILALLEHAQPLVEDLGVTARGILIHGDFCLSNILYDVETNSCKLVDPRGRFGRPGLFGDGRYDLAKLFHSVKFGYDHLVAGAYRLEACGNSIQLEMRYSERQRKIQETFAESFESPSSDWALGEIELISGLVFAGLAPLHPESPDRQVAFLIRAVEVLDDALILLAKGGRQSGSTRCTKRSGWGSN